MERVISLQAISFRQPFLVAHWLLNQAETSFLNELTHQPTSIVKCNNLAFYQFVEGPTGRLIPQRFLLIEYSEFSWLTFERCVL